MHVFKLGSNGKADFAIVGLGNPGGEYADTRHNAGFQAIDALGEQLGVRYWKNRHGCLEAEVGYKDLRLVLAKPQSYMNTSGGPVSQVMRAFGLRPVQVICIHDEMDLEPGTVRIKKGGGHAGHNGLRSMIDKLGSADFIRVRVGIGAPRGRTQGADFVLDRLKGDRLEEFKADCTLAADAALCVIDDGPDAAMNRFNRRS